MGKLLVKENGCGLMICLYRLEGFEVSDNGTGIKHVDFDTVCKKHCTSKIDSFADLLNGVSSYGFRGEALSNLCELTTETSSPALPSPKKNEAQHTKQPSVSGLSITTRREGDVFASKIRFDHTGNVVDVRTVRRDVGTTITVENLFQPLPVRRYGFSWCFLTNALL